MLVAGPGCMAATGILALAPIIKARQIETDKIVADFKVGSSGAGAKLSLSSHHSEHCNTVRPSRKLAVMGVSIISPDGLAIRPRIPESWRI